MSAGSELLTRGLSQGYAGKSRVETVVRGGFFLKSNQILDGGNYIDQWLPADTGGGQELADAGEDKYTRLYAGGVISTEQLKALGITKKDVIGYLIKMIGELGGKTRLFEDCKPGPDGDWEYSYVVTDRIEAVGLTRSLETVKYKGILVFVHGFEICPIRN